MKYEVIVGEDQYMIEIGDGGRLIVNGDPVEVDFARIGKEGLSLLLVNNESFEGLVESHEDLWHVLFRGDLYEVQVNDERAQLLKARATLAAPETGEIPIKAPMPGLVVGIPVAVGQEIKKGDNLIILESMKMANELKAPRDGKVDRINVKQGDSVDQNQILLVIV
jgi:biotin carboxyl carrier protein